MNFSQNLQDVKSSLLLNMGEDEQSIGYASEDAFKLNTEDDKISQQSKSSFNNLNQLTHQINKNLQTSKHGKGKKLEDIQKLINHSRTIINKSSDILSIDSKSASFDASDIPQNDRSIPGFGRHETFGYHNKNSLPSTITKHKQSIVSNGSGAFGSSVKKSDAFRSVE